MSRPPLKDQRKFARYSARQGTIVALQPNAEILGQMIDISLRGLSFRYIDTGTPDDNASELVILMPKPRFYLDRLPFRSVADFELPNEFSFSTIPVRRKCISFKPLNPTQQTKLEDFIQFCSIMDQQNNWLVTDTPEPKPVPQPS
jgi:hypothetical protein